MNKITCRSTIAVVAALLLAGPMAHATTLSNILGGGALIQGDVTFNDFFFDDRFTDDDPAVGPSDPNSPDREDNAIPGDRAVEASQIKVITFGTDSSVTLRVEIDPGIVISGQSSIFDFFLDFNVSVGSSSTRKITNVTLGNGDLFASGTAFSEVRYALGGFDNPGDRLAIFEDPSRAPASATQDTQSFAATSSIFFEGSIFGQSPDGTSSGLSTYSLTFDLSDTTPPPPNVVPVPASVVLLLAGLGGLGLVARRRRA